MLGRWRFAALAGLLGVLLVTVSLTEQTPKVKYNRATETKVGGTIEDVKEFECPISGTIGYHIALKNGDGVVMVHVAASKFMKEYEIVFEKGQRIEVVGSRVKLASGEDAVLAREIVRGQNTYTFRDREGNPLW